MLLQKRSNIFELKGIKNEKVPVKISPREG